ncbi:MAG: xylose isomerase [Verrucomicrobiae bacterium]|nr:xylose isomerase [Verrucomicrobiae bacterium]
MHTYFPEVRNPIAHEGPDTKNPLAFRHYHPKRKVAGKTMEEHLRFAIAYWHTFKGTGADPFGGGVYDRPWNRGHDAMDIAEKTLDAAFEFFVKLGVPYYCFHDRDIAPEGVSLADSGRNLERIVRKASRLQKETGVKLLWGTANLFSHPRYANGAATNPDPRVFAHAASQIRRAIEATIELRGSGYVFWGGREGYSSLLNTDLKQEREQLAAMLHMAVHHARKCGFKGMFFIEPKPREPSTHQYDFDAATTLGFLREFNLLDDFMLNIEANHATLATHSFEHELAVASAAGKLGSLDINRGDPSCGWDTDQFPNDLASATWTLYTLLRQGGLKYGGLNFDAKVRRGSFDTIDLFHGHIGGMDLYARALLIADRLWREKPLVHAINKRYAGFRSGMGKKALTGKTSLLELEKWAAQQGEPPLASGQQELLENTFSRYLYDV